MVYNPLYVAEWLADILKEFFYNTSVFTRAIFCGFLFLVMSLAGGTGLIERGSVSSFFISVRVCEEVVFFFF